jgi:hypothetical protein
LKEKKQIKIDVDLPSLNGKVHFSGEDTFVIQQQKQTDREDHNKSAKKAKYPGTINSQRSDSSNLIIGRVAGRSPP